LVVPTQIQLAAGIPARSGENDLAWFRSMLSPVNLRFDKQHEASNPAISIESSPSAVQKSRHRQISTRN
jgi:hypothetical protein